MAPLASQVVAITCGGDPWRRTVDALREKSIREARLGRNEGFNKTKRGGRERKEEEINKKRF